MSTDSGKTVAVIAIIGVVIILLLGLIGTMMMSIGISQGFGPNAMGFMPFGMSMMMFMFLTPVALIVLVVLGIAWLLWVRDERADIPSDKALEILKKRYASGEITKEEFEQLKADLENGN